jgi:putative holliday junction resolvase
VGKLIGIDYGTKRVGVAVSDETGSVAFPRTTLPTDGRLLDAILGLTKEENASAIVVGKSTHWDGTDTEVMAKIRDFVAVLKTNVLVPVEFEPEFYSSKEARREGQTGAVDAQAAAIILNSYINRVKQS